VAGVVEAVGKGVSRMKPGDEVFGIGMGSYAEYTRVPEDKLAPKPVNLTFEQAAVVPISGLTALQAVRDSGHVQPGQKVLIIGASGGVGTFAVQIAKSFGADVTGVCSTTKVDLVRSLGADQVIDYTREDFAEKRHHYDVILDTGGHSSLSRLRRALAPNGTLVIVGAETDGKWFGGFDRSIRAMLWSPLLREKLIAFVNSENAEDLVIIKDLIEAGKVTPTVDRTFSLDEAPKAISYLIEGHARGKVAITL
jgi:NADPH:quinone reductase-like Zn-dependent oxidoreductase